MAEFDRNAKPAEGSQAKKLIMVGVLGAVLLGVVAMQIMKSGPTPAAASPAGPGEAASAVVAADEAPEVLRAALMRDPTSSLLSGEKQAISGGPLRNPFRMGEAWRRSLIRQQVTVVSQVQTPSTRPDVRAPEIVPVAPLGLKPTDYKLAMILVSGDHLIALVNGSTVSKGDKIRDALVVDVRNDSVVLRHKDFQDGPLLELSLKGN